MGLKEGSVVLVNLRCGCQQYSVTLLNGDQRIRCPQCGQDTKIVVRINSDDEVSRFDVEWG